MVDRIADGLVGANAAPVGLVRTARVERWQTRCPRVDHVNRPVEIVEGDDEPRALRADITQIDEHVARNLLLHVQIPLLDVRVAQVLVVAHREVQRARRQGRRERVVEEEVGSSPGISDDARAGSGLRALGHGEDRIRNLRRVVPAVGAANHRVVCERRAPGEPHARGRVVAVRRDQPAPVARSLWGRDAGDDKAVLLDVHELVVYLLVGLEVVVAQAEVDREPRRELPVVVEVVGLPPVPEVGRCVSRVDARVAHIAEHEICERAPRVNPVESEAAAGRTRLLEGHLAFGDIGAEFQQVPVMLPREGIDELEDLVRAVARSDLALQIVHAEDAVGPVDVDRRRPVFLRQTGNQGKSHLAGDVVRGIVGGTEDLGFEEPVPPAPQLVDEGRAERVGPCAHNVLRAAQVVALVVAPERNTGLVSVVEDIPPGQRVVAGEDMVDTRVVIVLRGNGAGRSAREVLRPHLRVGQRHELEKHERLLAQPRGRNHVVHDAGVQRVAQRDRRAGARVGETAEITGPDGRGWDQPQGADRSLRQPARFPVEEEERPVGSAVELRDIERPADVRAELVPVQPRRRDALVGYRIVCLGERVVPVELPEGARQPVASPLGEHVDLPARGAAGLSRRVAGLDLEFGERVHGRRKRVRHRVVVHELDTVDEIAVRRVTRAVGGHRGGAERRVLLADGAAPAPDRNRAGRARLHARNQLRELHKVAPVERQVHDLGAVDHGAHGGVVGLQGHGVGLDSDRLGDVADPELHVDARRLLHLQRDAVNLLGLESSGNGGDRVVSGGQERERVAARLGGPGFANCVRRQVGGRDRHIGDNGSGRVCDGPRQGRGGLLRERGGRPDSDRGDDPDERLEHKTSCVH